MVIENTSQSAWLERGGNQFETRRLSTHCRGKCTIPSLEEIRADRADPGGPVLIEGIESMYCHPKTADINISDKPDGSEVPSYATSMHHSSHTVSPNTLTSSN